MAKKLSVLLGLRDKVEKTFGNMILDMLTKFKNNQGIFKGHRDTYTAIGDYADDNTKRGFKAVSGTVGEQLSWFKEHTKDYMEVVFSIEKSNATGVKADLIVEGKNWGSYSTLELLRLKSVLDGKMRAMVKELPIRSETEIWHLTTAPEFAGKDGVWETEIDKGFATTTTKRMEIINDPHIKDSPNRAPMVQQVDTKVNIGTYTKQKYSGEITNLQRAQMEVKLDKLYTAVVEALETANNVDSVTSDLGDKTLEYLF